MPIVYRTSGPWGPGIAEDLSAEQVDGNFHGLDQRVRTAVRKSATVAAG
jgi:hypothetical protein